MAEEAKFKATKTTEIPSITLEENPEEEANIFYDFLHSKDFPQHRVHIFNIDAYKPLKVLLTEGPPKSDDEEKQIIRQYLAELREDKKDQIQPFIDRAKKELGEEKTQNALKELASLMDYQWEEGFPGYRVVPVLLPFSPYGENVFYFSMIGIALGKKQDDLTFVAIHEISHMMFHGLVQKYFPQISSQESLSDALFYLKEVLAPVLMNQKPLADQIDSSRYYGKEQKGYIGNDDLYQMYVSPGDSGEKIQISKYFQSLYEKMRHQENKSFKEILETMINLVTHLEGELTKRRNLWNKYGHGIFKNEAILKEYAEPMIVAND